MKNKPGEFVFTDELSSKEYVEYEYFQEIHKIALESKLIIEQFQKLLGVWTTTEAFTKIVELRKSKEK